MAHKSYYQTRTKEFSLFRTRQDPDWRQPQFGALSAISAHWSLPTIEPALISLPTGTGKTAVAMATPYLARARRVLVIVPSTDLRRQTMEGFESQGILLRVGALTGSERPSVLEVTKRVSSWATLSAADVVVALPNSMSPSLYASNPPPSDLFDLVVIDEAHHSPAPTWRTILDYFHGAKAVLLTATPYRRDGQRLPGRMVYQYPLRQAIEDGVYRKIEAVILPPSSVTDRSALDAQIADEVVRLLAETEHASSTLLIRASKRERADSLATLYRARGLRVQVLHSGVGVSARTSIVQNLRSGSLRAVVVVGMLGEGFDLPSARILAYHDKHKSLAATAQIVGRLARAHPAYPQQSKVVTVRDVDVYPELQGVVRALYDEDADWGAILPGVIDDEIAADIDNRAYVQALQHAPPALSLESLQPIRRSSLRELAVGSSPKAFDTGSVPDELSEGRVLRGSTIIYSAFDVPGKTLILVTSIVTRPKWHDDPGLDSVAYGLHLFSLRQPPRSDLSALLFVNSDDGSLTRDVLKILAIDDAVKAPDPGRLSEAFDSLSRESVSSIGVRTTYAGRGTPSYRMFVGTGVDRGLRDADTAFSSLGHAMIQTSDADGSFTAGVATAKGKYWETRYAHLREYMEFVSALAARYWFPPASTTGQLLPQVSRGKRLLTWPIVDPLAAEFDFGLIGTGWHTVGGTPLDRLEIRAGRPVTATQVLPLEVVEFETTGPRSIWRGQQDIDGVVQARGPDITVQHGLGMTTQLSDLMTDRPPTIFFLNGTTVIGGLQFDSRARSRALPDEFLEPLDWTGVNIRAETRSRASKHARGISVHERLERYLSSGATRRAHRWIICNDGAGEIADYLVIEIKDKRTHVSLWHAKFAHGARAAVRIKDLEEVAAQAIKSRRWITEVGFWSELGARLSKRVHPYATVVDGNERLIKALCGEEARWRRLSYPVVQPIVVGHIGIFQPGLSESALNTGLASAAPSHAVSQSHELLTVVHDSISSVASVRVVCSV